MVVLCSQAFRFACTLMLAMVLGACSSQRQDQLETDQASLHTKAPSPRPAETAVASPQPQNLWTLPADQLRRLDSRLPPSLDPAEIVTSKYLHQAPIPTATIAIGMPVFETPSGFAAGEVAILSAEHGWRRVSMEAAGIRRIGHSEQQFALSPNGTSLALADPHRVVVIDLADATHTDFRVPSSDPVALRWTANGQHLT